MDTPDRRRAIVFPDDFRPFALAEVEQGIPRRFETLVERHPERVAVRYGSVELTYAELDRAANRCAHRLIAALPAGCRQRPVALLIAPSERLAVALLGILKADLVYAPLDHRAPAARIGPLLDALEPAAVLIDAHGPAPDESVAGRRCPIVRVDAAPDGVPDTVPERSAAPDGLACLFLTSGSTGAAKGVIDSHRNVLHNVFRYTNALGFAPCDRMSLLQRNAGFSGTLSTLLGALLNGACVVPFDAHRADTIASSESLGEWLHDRRISVFHGVPSLFRLVPVREEGYPRLRLVRLEGDRATRRDWSHYRRVCSERCVLVNGLGTTETGLVSQCFLDHRSRLPPGQSLPVGHAVDGVETDVVDASGRSCPPDTPGELRIESPYLALGYRDEPALTRQRFTTTASGARRYRSGDLGRLDDDGCLTLLGRGDSPPRIDGVTVDTERIESLLCAVDGVREALLRAVDDGAGGERRLVAYLVTEPGTVPTVGRLRERLEAAAQGQTWPTAWVFVDAFPLSADGKLDPRRLPPPGGGRPRLDAPFRAPRTALERRVADAWSVALGVSPVGIDDPFPELGGDSLRALHLVAALRGSLDPPPDVVDLYEHPTVRRLCRHAERDRAAASDGAPSGDVEAVRHPTSDGRGAGPAAPVATRALPDHAVAVLGMAGRFPGAADTRALWENLRAGRESITGEGPEPGEDEPSRHVAAAGVLEDTDAFDAGFFGLTPREARDLDPQQRVWLECVQHALEDACLPADRESLEIGVFAGARESAYLWHLLGGDRAAVDSLLSDDDDALRGLRLGNERDTIALRTAYLFDFTGPSVTVQSTCSTSLVAVAQACQALADGHCDVAVAGVGIGTGAPGHRGHRGGPGGIRSRDGHCRPFDAAASGTVFGDGVGVVVLARASDAPFGPGRAHAVIRGWAVNNDGAGKPSFAAPSVHGQSRVVIRALDHARVRASDIGYVEAHGTATPIGDPIEVAALDRAFSRRGGAGGRCALGSVKGNVGHLDVAAGITGLIKSVLIVREGEIPQSLHFDEPNPQIDFARTPFRVADRRQPWPDTDSPRIAGVSSLGVGGTNCHLIVQEPVGARDRGAAEVAEVAEAGDDGRTRAQLLAFSARGPEALRQLARDYERVLESVDPASLSALVQATRYARTAFDWRMAVVGADRRELAEALRRARERSSEHGRATAAEAPKVGLLFGGEGSPSAAPAAWLRELGIEPVVVLEHDPGERASDTVELARALERVARSGCDTLIEIGAGTPLGASLRERLAGSGVSVLGGPHRGDDDLAAMLRVVARLYVSGATIRWQALGDRPCARRVDLPPYPFQRTRYRHERERLRNASPADVPSDGPAPDADPLLGTRMPLPGSPETRFATRYGRTRPSYVADHRLFGVPVVPGAMHFALLAQARAHVGTGAPIAYRDLHLIRPLLFDDDAGRDVQLAFLPEPGGWSVRVLSRPARPDTSLGPRREWVEHLRGRAVEETAGLASPAFDIDRFVAGADAEISAERFYERQWANQGGTGRAFRWLHRAWRRGDEALCETRVPACVGDTAGYRLHPGLLEAACQVLHCCARLETREAIEVEGTTLVPARLAGLRVAGVTFDGADAWCRARLVERRDDRVVADLHVLSPRGEVVAELAGFELRRIRRERLGGAPDGAGASRDGRPVRDGRTAGAPLLDADAAPVPPAAPGAGTDDAWTVVRRLCHEALGCDVGLIAPTANPVELGFDSLSTLMLCNRLRRELGVSLDVGEVLLADSLGGLAGRVASARR